MVAVLTVLFAGDMLRHALTVPVWISLAIASTFWAVAVLVSKRWTWRQIPLPLVFLVGWWIVTPVWSSYATSSLLMLIPTAFMFLLGSAIVSAAPLDELIRRMALSLRLALVGSVIFEFVVGLVGRPLYPVGFVPTASTPIELAWSRGLFFDADARIQGLVGNANILGMLALVAAIIAVWRIIASRSWRTMSTLDLVIAAFLLARTMSATVNVAIAAIAVVFGIAAIARRTGNPWRVATWATLVGVVAAVGVALSQWTAVTQLLGKSPDLTHRFDIWTSVLERIVDQPLVGHGFVGWWPDWDPWFAIQSIDGLEMRQAHNLWLDLTMQTGIVGAVLFAITLGSILWTFGRTFVESPRSSATVPFLITIALTVQSLTESRLVHEWGFVLLVVFAVCAKRLRTDVSASS